MSTVMEPEVNFENVNLADIDPSASPVPVGGPYTFEVVSAGIKTFTFKKGDKAGQPGKYIKMDLVIVNDPKYSGRRQFESLFDSAVTLKQLRLLSDATGVSQGNGTLEQWLTDLGESKARFNAPIVDKMKKDVDGQLVPTGDTQVNFWKTSPAN